MERSRCFSDVIGSLYTSKINLNGTVEREAFRNHIINRPVLDLSRHIKYKSPMGILLL